MKFSPLVERIGGEGSDAWRTHSEAAAARDRGEDVIILSIGDPDINAPEAVVERAVVGRLAHQASGRTMPLLIASPRT